MKKFLGLTPLFAILFAVNVLGSGIFECYEQIDTQGDFILRREIYNLSIDLYKNTAYLAHRDKSLTLDGKLSHKEGQPFICETIKDSVICKQEYSLLRPHWRIDFKEKDLRATIFQRKEDHKTSPEEKIKSLPCEIIKESPLGF